MDSVKVTETQKKALAYATIISVIFAAFFLKRYFSMFVVASVLGYLFTPFYNRLRKKMSDGKAAATTVVVSLLSVMIPIFLVLLLGLGQIQSFSNSISSALTTLDVNKVSGEVVNQINAVLDSIPIIDYQVTQESLINNLRTVMEHFGKAFVSFLTSTLGSFFSIISSAIIYIFIFFSIVKNGETLVEVFKSLNPLGDDVAELYVQKISAMVKGTVVGQLVIATVQGFLAALTVSFVTDPMLFFVLFILFTAFSIIPLGAGIIVIPIGIVIALFGNFWGGFLIVMQHLVINTNIDNILRPMLVPKTARLDSALMLVSVFAGLSMFGFLGIIIGPTIMILIVTTIKVYLDIYKNVQISTITDKKKKRTN